MKNTNCQYGFRRNCGTNTALSEIVDRILCDMNNRKKCTGLFMDLSKAFDCVNHEILLNKLERMGIRGVALKLFESYLTDRQIIVSANETLSSSKKINISVPQGSVLGPILHLLYVNDLCKLQLRGHLALFADDTSTFYSSNSFETNMESINEDMAKINEYFRINKLTLNLKKTHYINFGRSKTAEEYSNGIDCEGTLIEHTKQLKFLGLHIDSQLSWAKHIDCLCAKLSGAIGVLRKLNFLPVSTLRKLYYAIVNPHLKYAAAIWTKACQTQVNTLQVIQRMAIKSCHKLAKRFGTMELFCNVAKTILPIKAIGTLQTCTIVHSALHRLSRTNFKFTYEEKGRTRRTQTKRLVKIRVNVKTYGENAISYAGPNEYDK